MKPLEDGASREEVLAAVEEHELRMLDLRDVEFPPVSDGFEGCVMSLDGMVIAHYGRRGEDPVREAQDRAGEEDQSQPGWDLL